MLRPRALAPYLRLFLRPSSGPRLTYTGHHLRQMGGDFVVTADGVLALAHASHDPADRSSVDDLLAALARPPADD